MPSCLIRARRDALENISNNLRRDKASASSLPFFTSSTSKSIDLVIPHLRPPITTNRDSINQNFVFRHCTVSLVHISPISFAQSVTKYEHRQERKPHI